MTLRDGTELDAYFTDKGPKKSSISLQHRGLPDKPSADRSREAWGERLMKLGGVIDGPTA